MLEQIKEEKKLVSLECILAFEQKWQAYYEDIKTASAAIQLLYTDILVNYVLLSDDLSSEEEVVFDSILERYAGLELVHSG